VDRGEVALVETFLTIQPVLWEMAATADEMFESAYGDFAAFYDRFTADHDYDLWVSVVERLARRHGFDGDELIDAACGTGKSFLPWARRGFRVRGLDRSREMLALAREKCEAEDLPVDLLVHDLRLPATCEPATLVTCLDDALNYQSNADDLDSFVAGLATLVTAGGLIVFDTNSRWTYANSYTRTSEVDDGGVLMRWQGGRLGPDRFDAEITVWQHEQLVLRSRHCQRYWPRARVERSLSAADLHVLDVYGMSRDGAIDQPADDDRHSKFLYVVTR
jgi:hypothetical protein